MALPNEFVLFGQPLIGLFALAPLFAALSLVKRPGEAALVTALFGAVSTVLSNYWLVFFGDFAIWTIGGTTLGYTMFHALLGVFLWKFSRTKGLGRPFVLAALWTVYEYLKSVGFLGYPWGLAAYPLGSELILAQSARIFGPWGLSFLVVSTNAVIAAVLDAFLRGPSALGASTRRTRADLRLQFSTLAALFAITITYGVVSLTLSDSLEADHEIDILMVQQNGDSWFTSDFPGTLRRAQETTREGVAARPTKPELIVWSETALRHPIVYHRRWYASNPVGDPYLDFAESLDTWLLTGSPYVVDLSEGLVYNAVFMFDPDHELVETYEKQHLVPFAEHIPFWHIDVWREFFRNVVGLGATWAVGTGYETLPFESADGTKFMIGAPICFEDAFGYLNRALVLRGADMLVNLTNNAWSRTNSAQTQHFVAARFRAIENGRTLVRSTNAGYTSVVDPWGRVVGSMPMFVADYLRLDVPVYTDIATPYTFAGDLFPFVLMGILALVLFADIDRREVLSGLR